MCTIYQASFLRFSTLEAFALNSVGWKRALKCSRHHRHATGLQDFNKWTKMSEMAESDSAITLNQDDFLSTL